MTKQQTVTVTFTEAQARNLLHICRMFETASFSTFGLRRLQRHAVYRAGDKLEEALRE